MATAAGTGPSSTDAGQVVLRAVDITKSYGGIHALKGVNFEVHQGKVTTLFGENGAGKSTLMKILSGVESPTSGELSLRGEPVRFSNTVDARERGIAIIHQELSLAPNLSVRDNIFMGRELRTRTGAVDYKTEDAQVRSLMQRLVEDVDPSTLVSDLRLGQQQVVEIARALSVDARILIMDEPTSALSATEVEVLFKVIADLKAAGVSIVYISHHLEEALLVTDFAVVLRDGALVASDVAANIDLDWIVGHMVGRNFDLGTPPEGVTTDEVVLEIDSATVIDPHTPERKVVNDVSISVRKGEIVCIYGLMGAGRTEMLEAVAGRTPLAAGRVLLGGVDMNGLSVAQRIDVGLALVPEDRQRDGLVQTMSVGANLSLASLGSFVRGLFLARAAEARSVSAQIQSVGVKTDGPRAEIGSLSGGNQQKVVIGKMLMTNPKAILLDEPSRGIDVGAKAEVFRLLASLAANGLAVLYSTSEVGESLSIAHRIIVMRKGRIAAEFDARTATKEQVMAASGESTAALDTNGTHA